MTINIIVCNPMWISIKKIEIPRYFSPISCSIICSIFTIGANAKFLIPSYCPNPEIPCDSRLQWQKGALVLAKPLPLLGIHRRSQLQAESKMQWIILFKKCCELNFFRDSWCSIISKYLTNLIIQILNFVSAYAASIVLSISTEKYSLT